MTTKQNTSRADDSATPESDNQQSFSNLGSSRDIPRNPTHSGFPDPDSGFFSPSTSFFDFEEQLSINCDEQSGLAFQASGYTEEKPPILYNQTSPTGFGMSRSPSGSSSVTITLSTNPPTPSLPLRITAGELYRRRRSCSYPYQQRSCQSKTMENVTRPSSAPASISGTAEKRTTCTQTEEPLGHNEGTESLPNLLNTASSNHPTESRPVATVQPLVLSAAAGVTREPELEERPEPEGQEDYTTAEEGGEDSDDAMNAANDAIAQGIRAYRASLAPFRVPHPPVDDNMTATSAEIGANLQRMADDFDHNREGMQFVMNGNMLEFRPVPLVFFGGLFNVNIMVAVDRNVAFARLPVPIRRIFQWIWGFALVRQLAARIV